MEANHGDDWVVALAALQAPVSEEEEAEDDEDGEEETTTGAAAGTGSLQASTTGEFLNPGAAARSASPGSGVYNTPRRSSQGGVATPGSWRSDNAGSPGGLARTINKAFNPTEESLSHYENRLRRQVFALAAIGEAVPAGRVDVLLTKARIVSGAPTKEVLSHLKREFAMCLLEDDSA